MNAKEKLKALADSLPSAGVKRTSPSPQKTAQTPVKTAPAKQKEPSAKEQLLALADSLAPATQKPAPSAEKKTTPGTSPASSPFFSPAAMANIMVNQTPSKRIIAQAEAERRTKAITPTAITYQERQQVKQADPNYQARLPDLAVESAQQELDTAKLALTAAKKDTSHVAGVEDMDNLGNPDQLAKKRAHDQAVAAAQKRVDEAELKLTQLAGERYEAKNQAALQKTKADPVTEQAYSDVVEGENAKKLLSSLLMSYTMGPTPFAGDEESLDQIERWFEEKYGLTHNDLVLYSMGDPAGAAAVARVTEEIDRATKDGEDIVRQGGGAEALDLYRYEQRKVDQQAAEKRAAKHAAFASESPVHAALASMGSVASTFFQPADILNVDWGRGDPGDPDYVPPDTSNMVVTQAKDTARGTVAQNIRGDGNNMFRNAAAFLYNTGMSGADSVALATTMGPATPFIMSSNATVSGMKDTIDRGGTRQQALAIGAANAIAEYFFEKVSIDQLLTPKSITDWKSFAKEGFKQSGVEASEEGLTTIANIMADTAIMGANSDFQTAVRDYMDDGLSEDEAKRRAYLDQFGQVALDAFGGALSGGMMSTVYNAPAAIGNAVETRRADAQTGRELLGMGGEVVQDVIGTGLESDKGTKSYKLAKKLQDKQGEDGAGKVSPRKLGRLYRENVATVEAETSAESAGAEPDSAAEPETTTPASDGIGPKGREAIGSMLVFGQDMTTYKASMREVYQAGREGRGVDTLPYGTVSNLTTDQAVAAYNAGVEDAAQAADTVIEDEKAASAGEAGNSDPLKAAIQTVGREASARNFRNAIDKWDGVKQTVFDVGVASAPLQSVGVKERKIRFQSEKVKGILDKHPGMTREIIKQAPDILQSPVLVAKSKTHDSRIVVFGEVTDTNGAPVLAALELQPMAKDGEVLDVINLSSLYGKDKNPADFIRSSDIIYLDPNKSRTEAWLQSVGLQLPSDTTSLGPIGSVTYEDGKVKIAGTPIFQPAAQSVPADTPETTGGPVGVGAAAKGFGGPYDELVSESGTFHPEGENPARIVDVPTKDADGRSIPKSVATVMEAQMTPDEVLGEIQDSVASGTFSFDTNTDEGAKARARMTVEDNGWDGALALFRNEANKGKVSKDLVALGQLLLNNAMNAPTPNSKTVIDILTAYTAMSTTSAQALQAQRMLKKLTPEGKLYACQQSIAAFQAQLVRELGKRAPDIQVPTELYDAYLNAADDAARTEAMKDIYQAVADQVPSTFADKWNAIRYTAMLFNPKTNIRNILGNVAYSTVRGVDNALSWGIQNVVNLVSRKLGGEGITKNKSVIFPLLSRLNKSDRALVEACYGDVVNVEGQLLGEGKYGNSVKGEIDERRTIFKSNAQNEAVNTVVSAMLKPLEATRKASSKVLDLGDVVFSRPAYAGALAGYLKANGVTAEMVESGTVDPEVMVKAREYAVKEAQRATFRDANEFSDFVAKARYKGKNKVGKAVNIVAEGNLPFLRTPANVLVRGVEHTPAYILKGIKNALVDVRKGNMTAAEAIDEIASGLTGTGIIALGYLLASWGLLSGAGGDDDEDKLNDLTGGQDHALNLPGGWSATLNWLAPASMPLFVGVALHDAASDVSDGKMDLNTVLDAIYTIADPVLESSMLSGLQDSLKSLRYNDEGALIQLFANSTLGYLSQGAPTLFGQIEQVMEPERKETFVDRTSGVPTAFQRWLGKTGNKLPGEFQQIPYIDAWGRRESNGDVTTRIMNAFFNPAYTSKRNETAADKELGRLLEAGQEGVVPGRPSQSDTICDEHLTAEEYVRYAEDRGQTSYKLVSGVIENRWYKDLSDADKAAVIRECYNYANQNAKRSVKPKYEVESWVDKAQQGEKKYGIPVDTYIMLRQNTRDIEALRDEDGDSIADSKGLQIMKVVYDNTGGMSDRQRRYLFEALGVGKRIIDYSKSEVNRALKEMN